MDLVASLEGFMDALDREMGSPAPGNASGGEIAFLRAMRDAIPAPPPAGEPCRCVEPRQIMHGPSAGLCAICARPIR